VTELEFPSSTGDDIVRGADLPDFGVFPRLTKLDMQRVNFDAAALAKLRDAVGLRRLSLTESRLPSGWNGDLGLSSMPHLERSGLWGVPVGDAGLSGLETLANLKSLDLAETGVTDVGMARLAGLRSLESLHLAGTSVTDAGMAGLAGLRSLEGLDLTRTSVTGAGLGHLAGMTRLKRLRIWSNKVATDEGIEVLASLEGLEKLQLVSVKIGDGAIRAIRALPKLTELDLSGARVTDACIPDLIAMPALRELEIDVKPPCKYGLSPAGLAEFMRARPGVKVISPFKPKETQQMPLGSRVLPREFDVSAALERGLGLHDRPSSEVTSCLSVFQNFIDDHSDAGLLWEIYQGNRGWIDWVYG
jgi:hypothetical protein